MAGLVSVLTNLSPTMTVHRDIDNGATESLRTYSSGPVRFSLPAPESTRRDLLICLLLAVCTLAVFWPVVSHDFVNYDDTLYVTENPQVQAGLTKAGLAWAFGRLTGEGTYWHPLTWVSHMLDCELYGLRPGGHHLTNLLFHVANSILLFIVLKRMTGASYKSALVAALFALHPFQVDSVAWIAERKNLLSAFFGMLTLLAYIRYVEQPNPWRYGLVLLCFILSLMAKPLLVTLPCVLLLLDFWPLRRWTFRRCASRQQKAETSQPNFRPFARPSVIQLVGEKLPLFVLAAVSSIVTFISHQSLGVLISARHLSWMERVGNALVSYWRYIRKMIWPSDLAVFYPYSGAWPFWQVAGAGLLLVSVSVLVASRARNRSYLLVGWLWFLGTLLPFIGLVQASVQSMADRFVYVPLIGLFIMLAWGVPDCLAAQRLRRVTLPVAAIAILSAYSVATWFQVGHWRNSENLFRHAIEVTANNFVAHNNLGNALALRGQTNEAVAHYIEALRIEPNYPDPHGNLGLILASQGQIREAVAHYREALRIDPASAGTLNNLAWLLASHQDPQFRDGAEAVSLAERACQLTGNRKAIMVGTLAAAYAEAGRFTDAIITAEKARDIALAAGEKELASKNQALLERYRRKRPVRESP